MRLSEVIGAAHAIRVLCRGQDDQHWRGFMVEMLELEAPENGSLRQSMVTAFNEAYTTRLRDLRQCDTAAQEAEESLALLGQVMAEELTKYHFPKAD